MQVNPIKTHKITTQDNLFAVLERYVIGHSGASAIESHQKQQGFYQSANASFQDDTNKIVLQENSVLAVTSKIVSLTEKSTVSLETNKQELIEKEADYYLPRSSSKYEVQFTIKNNMLSANAGVDESNANGQYVLWPKNPQASANAIREYIAKKFGINFVGVVITDSKASPLRWGVTGMAIAHSGFNALKNYIQEPDLFGRPFHFEKLNIADSLAASSVFVMGEGAEQTPMAIITDLPQVEFQGRDPTDEELKSLQIDIEDDLYAPLLTAVKWEKGRK